jgi:hypothetical protein
MSDEVAILVFGLVSADEVSPSTSLGLTTAGDWPLRCINLIPIVEPESFVFVTEFSFFVGPFIA